MAQTFVSSSRLGLSAGVPSVETVVGYTPQTDGWVREVCCADVQGCKLAGCLSGMLLCDPSLPWFLHNKP